MQWVFKHHQNKFVQQVWQQLSILKKQKKDARCYVIGESGLSAAIQEEGLQLVHNENCDYVIVGLDREITYEKLAIGCLAIQQGAVFISTNSDVAIPSENGLLPGNGSLTSVLTVATGKQPTFIGKPEKIIVEEALRLLGIKPEDTLIVGDNYETDIKAGIAANIDTLMVFTGVTPYEKYEKLSKKADISCEETSRMDEKYIRRILI